MSHDDRARLEAVRDRLEQALADPDTAPRDLASLAREHRQTLTALGQLAPPEGNTTLDEISARRRQRGAS